MDKGGSSSTSVDIPEWWEDAARENLARSGVARDMGPPIWMGADVAAASPLQEQYFKAAGAGGMGAGLVGGPMDQNYLPEAQEFAGGVKGYSGWPGVEENMASVDERFPGLMDSLYELYPALAPEGWEGEPFVWAGIGGEDGLLDDDGDPANDGTGVGGGGGGSGDWSDDDQELDYDEGIPEYDDFDAAVAGVFGGPESGSEDQGWQE